MASQIKIKRSSVAGKVPTTSDIATGELAINTKDKKIYSSNGTVVFDFIAPYLQVANAASTYLPKTNPVITGTLTANGSVGTAGYYLRTSGSGIYWSPVSASGGGGGGASWAALTSTNTALRTLISDRYQVANVNVLLNAKATWTALTGTNTAIRTLVSDRLQVSNAASIYLTKNNPVVTGTLTANGSSGASGYFLRSTGTGVHWAPLPTITTTSKTLNQLLGSDTVITSVSGSGGSSSSVPTKTYLKSGSGTYTVPTGVRLLSIRMVGGGGGGGGGSLNTTYGAAGSAGTNTTFGSSFLIANGGSGADNSNGPGVGGGAGGSGTIGAGATGIVMAGGKGTPGGFSDYSIGGSGGTNPFGGAGVGYSPGSVTSGTAGSTNTGAGGGGGGGPSASYAFSGHGGGAGGYVEAEISSPAASYAYVVGGGGNGGAGTSSGNGGAGGSGVIIITEYY